MKKFKNIIVILIIIISLLGLSTKVINNKLKITDSFFTTKEEVVIDNRANIIDEYFKSRNMPLAGYGSMMIEVADKNGLDWRLLPAISIRETSGGKHMCKTNPFGWGSCKIGFKSVEEAIETVGYKLANLPVYKGTTTEDKLYHYNGTVLTSYPQEVISIMNSIGSK